MANHPEPFRLGLAPTMRVDDKAIELALKVMQKADADHDKFEDKHEDDCKGMVCPGVSVQALEKKKRN